MASSSGVSGARAFFSHCNPVARNQTTCSLLMRVSAVAFGIILIAVGTSAVCRSNNVDLGFSLIAGGGTSLLLGFCLKKSATSPDERASDVISKDLPADLSAFSGDDIRKLFPIYSDVECRNTEKKFARLDLKRLNQILPRMDGYLLRKLPASHLGNGGLNLSTLSEKQVGEMFPIFTPKEIADSKTRFKSLAEKVLNQVVPKMNTFQLRLFLGPYLRDKKVNIQTLNLVLPKLEAGLLRLIPDEYLQSEELDLSALPSSSIEYMFPIITSADALKSIKTLEILSVKKVNQLLPNMNSDLLRLIPTKHLQDKELRLSQLPAEQIQAMFFPSPFDPGETKKMFDSLPQENRDKVILKMTLPQLTILGVVNPSKFGKLE